MLEISRVCDTYRTVTEHIADESLVSVLPLLRLVHSVLVHQLEVLRGGR
jgi:hypothetical protein